MKRFIVALLLCCTALPVFAGMKEADEAMKKEDYPAALKKFTALANKGDAEAQFKLGAMYGAGTGVEADDAKAFVWYRKAAEQNHAYAQWVVSASYGNGLGVAVSEADALKWLQKSADQSFARAQNDLGDRYYDGTGVKQDFTEALAWYRKAAAQNYAMAQRNIGYVYRFGKGAEINLDEAAKWYVKAADQGLVVAEAELGSLYMQRKQFLEGLTRLTKAAEEGNTDAIIDIGIAHAKGDGVKQDLPGAYMFIVLAADIGHNKRAINIKEKLATLLSEDEKKRASAEALRWGMQHQYMMK